MITEKQCKKCKKVFSISQFGNCKRNKDGRDNFCRECRYEKKYKKKRPVKDYIPDSYRKCTKCNEIRPLEDFPRDKTEVQGRKYTCKFHGVKINNPVPVGYKFCTYCQSLHPIEEFHIKDSKTGRRQAKCKKAMHEIYLKKNSNRKHRNNRTIIGDSKWCPKCKAYHHISGFNKNDSYCRKCSNALKRSEEYKAKARIRNKKYYHNVIKNDPEKILAKNIRNRFNKLMKKLQNGNLNSNTSALDLLGCSLDEFKIHIEKQFADYMNWDNYGTVWHLDHIYPLSKIDITREDHKKLFFSYINLRPLEKGKNFQKSDNIIMEDLKKAGLSLEDIFKIFVTKQ